MSRNWQDLRSGVLANSAEETMAWGAALATALPDNSLLALEGDLGAGKTTFVKGLARGLGITANITSPTFNICLTYRGSRNLAHCDAYRLENPEAFEALHLEDYLEPPWILALEWPGRVPSDWLDQAWTLHLTPGDSPETRHLHLHLP